VFKIKKKVRFIFYSLQTCFSFFLHRRQKKTKSKKNTRMDPRHPFASIHTTHSNSTNADPLTDADVNQILNMFEKMYTPSNIPSVTGLPGGVRSRLNPDRLDNKSPHSGQEELRLQILANIIKTFSNQTSTTPFPAGINLCPTTNTDIAN